MHSKHLNLLLMSLYVTVKFMHLTIKKDLFKDFLSGTAQCYCDGRRVQNSIDFMQQLLNSPDHYNYPGGSVMLGLLCNSSYLASSTEAF